jgi:hypothetical protein
MENEAEAIHYGDRLGHESYCLVLCQNIILGLFPGLVVGALALKRSLQTLIFSVDATLAR